MSKSSQRLAGWILGSMIMGLLAGAAVSLLGPSHPELLAFARRAAAQVLDPLGRGHRR